MSPSWWLTSQILRQLVNSGNQEPIWGYAVGPGWRPLTLMFGITFGAHFTGTLQASCQAIVAMMIASTSWCFGNLLSHIMAYWYPNDVSTKTASRCHRRPIQSVQTIWIRVLVKIFPWASAQAIILCFSVPPFGMDSTLQLIIHIRIIVTTSF